MCIRVVSRAIKFVAVEVRKHPCYRERQRQVVADHMSRKKLKARSLQHMCSSLGKKNVSWQESRSQGIAGQKPPLIANPSKEYVFQTFCLQRLHVFGTHQLLTLNAH